MTDQPKENAADRAAREWLGRYWGMKRADADSLAALIRKERAEARREGAEAMRESAVAVTLHAAKEFEGRFHDTARMCLAAVENVRSAIRALPIPGGEHE